MNSGQKVAFVVLCAIGLAAFGASRSNAPVKTGREICNGVTNADILRVQQAANKIGLFPGQYGEKTEVNERIWEELSHDRKVATALMVYCSLGKGHTYLTLRGWRDGEEKAYIVDGYYQD